MKFLIDFTTNYPLVSAGAAWVAAQILKLITGAFKIKKFTWTEFFFGTGGMPSSHTAAVCSLVTACAIKCGVGSVEFAVSFILAMIVIRDATGMRRQVGEHAKALNIILKEIFESKGDHKLAQKAFGELVGHTPLQVFAGAIVGVVVAFLMTLIPAFGIALV